MLMLLLMLLAISATAQGGYVYVETTVCVHLEEVKVEVGETFTVYINVCKVSGLQGFDFMLSYDTRFLDCIGLDEGAFLAGFGSTFVAKQEIDDSYTATLGRVWLAVVILGEGYADGDGTLAMITFDATDIGESLLDVYSDYPHKPDEVKLTTCGSQAIPNQASDGYVTVVASNPGEHDDPPDPVDPPSPDVNGDGIVDIEDLCIIASVYGTVEGDNPGYYLNADLDQNGKIDICDLVIAAQKFGQTV